jgi:hypothetical protein
METVELLGWMTVTSSNGAEQSDPGPRQPSYFNCERSELSIA